MKKILTIKATIEIDDDENPIKTFDDCLDYYDNIDIPLDGLKDAGWNVEFVSLKDEYSNVNIDKILNVINFGRTPKYKSSDINLGVPPEGWS